ncbi:MAG: hypothetical protein U0894_11760 [Pirellulales bacterium]
MLYLASNTMYYRWPCSSGKASAKKPRVLNSVFALLLLLILAGHQGPASPCYSSPSAAQIWRRIETFANAAKGIVVHSQFQGFPYLAMKLPFVKDEDFA